MIYLFHTWQDFKNFYHSYQVWPVRRVTFFKFRRGAWKSITQLFFTRHTKPHVVKYSCFFSVLTTTWSHTICISVLPTTNYSNFVHQEGWSESEDEEDLFTGFVKSKFNIFMHTTHNTQHTTHNTQHTTHNTQHTTHRTNFQSHFCLKEDLGLAPKRKKKRRCHGIFFIWIISVFCIFNKYFSYLYLIVNKRNKTIVFLLINLF
jgi:hypothetical protein